MSDLLPTPPSSCRSCGVTAHPDSKYCHNCGTPILSEAELFEPAERAMDFFPNYMVTLVSIIQAAVLGYLLLAAQEQLRLIFTGIYDPLWTTLIVAVFIMILATWVQYTRAIAVVRLVPSTLDSVIPFILGATRALVIFFITLQQIVWFYFAFSLDALIGLTSYVSILREANLHQNRAANRIFLARLGPASKTSMRIMALRSAIFFLFGVVEWFLKLESLVLAVIVLCMNLLLFFFVHRNTTELLQK